MQKRNVLIWLGITAGCLVLIVAIGIARWIRLAPLLGFQSEAALYTTPIRIPQGLNTADAKDYTRFQAFGYRFNLPWQPVSTHIKNDQMSGVIFESGQVFLLYNPDATIGWLDEFKRPENAFVLTRLEKAYGTGCCDSVFKIVSRILEATPERISFFRSFEKNTAEALLLTYKRLYVDPMRKTIFYFEAQSCKGYQIGADADAGPVRLLIFPNDNIELKADIQGLKQAIPQVEIDALPAGFRSDPAARNSN